MVVHGLLLDFGEEHIADVATQELIDQLAILVREGSAGFGADVLGIVTSHLAGIGQLQLGLGVAVVQRLHVGTAVEADGIVSEGRSNGATGQALTDDEILQLPHVRLGGLGSQSFRTGNLVIAFVVDGALPGRGSTLDRLGLHECHFDFPPNSMLLGCLQLTYTACEQV